MIDIAYDKSMGRWNVKSAPQRGKILGYIMPARWQWKFITDPRHEEPFDRTESRSEMEENVRGKYDAPPF